MVSNSGSSVKGIQNLILDADGDFLALDLFTYTDIPFDIKRWGYIYLSIQNTNYRPVALIFHSQLITSPGAHIPISYVRTSTSDMVRVDIVWNLTGIEWNAVLSP